MYSDARILVIDGDSDAARFLTDTLEQAGYNLVRSCTDRAALAEWVADEELDLIVYDMGPQEGDGVALLEELRHRLPRDEFLPVVAIGPRTDSRLAVEALQAGAHEYLGRPLEPDDLLARVDSLLDIRCLYLRLCESKRGLEDQLRRRVRENQETHLELLERLTRVAELRDDPSGGHPGRVGRLAGLIAQELMLPAEETRCLLRAAPLHDLGNVGIPDDIVHKEGGFNEEQREQMHEHTSLGAYLLHGADNTVLQMAELVALNHHERWDGLGYPRGLSQTAIPLPARIVAVADALDAMTHSGMYKEPSTVASAIDEIRRESGWQFDPEVVAALVRVYERQPSMLTITPRAPRKAPC
jgi:putative two-component system response regulator